jgi:hypothetical protein
VSVMSAPLGETQAERPRVVEKPWFAAVLAAAALGIVIVKYGVSLHPNWFRFDGALDAWPDMGASPLAVGDRALLSNAAPAWIAGAGQLPQGTAYTAYSIGLTLMALGLPFAMRLRKVDRLFVPVYAVLLVGGSLAPVLLLWVGGYDALLVIGLTLGALSRRLDLRTCGWFLASVTHASVALPAAIVWLTFHLCCRPTTRQQFVRLALPVGVGLAAGYLTIRLATESWGGSTDRLALFQAIPYHLIMEAYLGAFPAIVLSGLGIGWLLIALPRSREEQSTLVFAACAAIVVLTIPLVAVDETRVTALVLVPLTLAWLDRLALSASSMRRLPNWVVAVAVVLPVPVVWMGVSYWPYWM